MKKELEHGHARREMTLESISANRGNNDPGLFGRMFGKLDPLKVPDAALHDLAQSMIDKSPNDVTGDNNNVPAGFTYLGQFVDHDITLDITPLDSQIEDADGIKNFRTPSLELDSLYGQGPGVSPYLYARVQTDNQFPTTPRFLIGETTPFDTDASTNRPHPNDLPRNRHGRALIGDERNDENLLVAQTHLAFLKFHNAIVDHLMANGVAEDKVFEEARRLTRWHYQWIVLYDFIERITEDGLIDKIRHDGRKFYRFPKSGPYMPVEFSAAAYRLGHSMVRQNYDHNRLFQNADFSDLFQFTGKSGFIAGSVGGVPTLPSNWIIDWKRFHEIGGSAPANMSRKLDPFLAPELHTLPGGAGNLALLNLKRGVLLGLPSGQDVARHMKVAVLEPDAIASGPDGNEAKKHGLHLKTPLWYYILKEAEQLCNGERLGPVGRLIVAEVFLGLVHGDKRSFLWLRKNWKPELPSAQDGHFTMADLLSFVGDVNPIGDGPN